MSTLPRLGRLLYTPRIYAGNGATMPDDAMTLDMFLRFFGRLHPMVVHFPIALLVTAAVIELWSPKRNPEQKGPGAALVCLTIGALGAVAAAAFGWLNAEYENHGRALAQTLFWHRWLGVSLAVVSIVTWIFALIQAKKPNPGTRRCYRIGLLATVGLVAGTGHLGGVMTHGDTYLTAPFEARNRPKSDASSSGEAAGAGDASVSDGGEASGLTSSGDTATKPMSANAELFAKQVAPILAAHCIECHGPAKKKAGLRLDNKDEVFADKQEGLVVAGKPIESLLYEVVADPASPDEQMPKDSDPLTAAQLKAIHDWIAGGAEWPDSVVEILADPDAKPVEESPKKSASTEATGTDAAAKSQASAESAEDRAAREAARGALLGRGIHVQQIAANTSDLEANFAVLGKRATDDDVAKLAGLEKTLTWLNLSRTSLSDAGVSRLKEFSRLEKVNLAQTGVSDQGLESLAGLAELEYLNLFGTEVTDASLATIRTFPKLQKLYLWNTKVTDDGVAALRADRPTLTIDRGEAAKVIAELNPPKPKPIAPKPDPAKAAADKKAAEKAAAEKAAAEKKAAEKKAAEKKPKPREEDTGGRSD